MAFFGLQKIIVDHDKPESLNFESSGSDPAFMNTHKEMPPIVKREIR